MSGRSNVGEMLGRELSEAVVLYHEAIARKIGISATEWKCLELLTRAGPTTAKRLAEASGLTTGAITGIVDRLEKAGYVRREDNPGDRRSVVIRPLRRPDLVKALTPIFANLGRAMGDLAGGYSEKDLALVQGFFEKTVTILRGQTAKLAK
jgi:DNA-binding MarR family transcriptional regulator